jgi:hypothetical protein
LGLGDPSCKASNQILEPWLKFEAQTWEYEDGWDKNPNLRNFDGFSLLAKGIFMYFIFSLAQSEQFFFERF